VAKGAQFPGHRIIPRAPNKGAKSLQGGAPKSPNNVSSRDPTSGRGGAMTRGGTFGEKKE